MLTDVAGAGGQRWRDKGVEVEGGGVGGGRRQAAESRGGIVFGHKTLNSDLSNFIPADRCLAGQNIHARGGLGEEGGGAAQVEDDLREGDQSRSCLPSPAFTLPPPLIWKR